MDLATRGSTALEDHVLWSGLTAPERTDLLARAEIRRFGRGEVILAEGATNTALFVLEHGTVEVCKMETARGRSVALGTIGPGGVFGDMSFIRGTACSATVTATEPVTVRVIDRGWMNADGSAHQGVYHKLVAQLVGTATERLDATNANYARSVVNYIEALETQHEFGRFFVIVIVTFGIGSIANRIVNDYLIDTTSNLFSWAYLLILFLPVLSFVRYFRYPLAMFGLTAANWKPSLVDGIVSGGVAVVLFLGGYWLVRQLAGQPLERSLLAISDPRLLGVTLPLYFFHAYLQEFIARGVMQTSLQKFLGDSHGKQAVLFTSMIFGVFHLHIGIAFSLIVFAGSVLFGLLYLRTRNLLGVSILHWLLGLCTIHVGLM